jgi:hypothetical protein
VSSSATSAGHGDKESESERQDCVPRANRHGVDRLGSKTEEKEEEDYAHMAATGRSGLALDSGL